MKPRILTMIGLSLFYAVGCTAPEDPEAVEEYSGGDTVADDLAWSHAKEGGAVTLTGTVAASITTYDNHGSLDSEMEYHLERSPGDNERVRLYFDGAPPAVETGDEITVAGKWQTRSGLPSIAVSDVRSIRKPSDVAQNGELGVSHQALVSVRPPKVHKMAVLLVGKTSVTTAQAQAMINANSPGSAAAFIGENSGRIDTFMGDVFAYPSINTSSCTMATVGSIQTAARNAFEAAGHTLDNYTNVAYVIGGGTCDFVASSSVTPPGSSSLATSTFSDGTFGICSLVAHELGHTLGFHHAHSTACGSSSVYNASRIGCTDGEYGNWFDTMGISGGNCKTYGHYGIVHKRYAGYLSKCEDVTAGGSAVFDLSPMEGSCGMRSLRIPIAGESNYYYLEYRRPGSGEFAGAGGAFGTPQARVLLNVSNDPAAQAPDAYLLDATPTTSSISDAWLAVGTTYRLPGNVSIMVQSIGDTAKIQVTMPAGVGAKCQDGTTPPSSGGALGGLCGPMTYQAESLTFGPGCTLSTAYGGYTGTGFMAYGGKNSIVEWNNVKVPSAGQYQLTFRYANGGSAARPCAVNTNDNFSSVAPVVQFVPSGAWTTWRVTTPITVTLRAGNNKIRVTASTTNGGPDLDRMDISSQR